MSIIEFDVFLDRLGILRVLVTVIDEHVLLLGRHADRPDRHRRVVHVLGDLLLLRIGRVLSDGPDRDAVQRQAEFAVEERLVVVRVVPRQHAGDEGLVELLDVFERGDRLRRVDHDLVLVVDDLAAECPQRPLAPPVGVARGVAEREAGRRIVLLQGLAQLEEAGGVLGEFIRSRPPSRG
ncbi:hypothetical protein ACVWYI_003679 [Bradyrhizobium sp. LB13.1]